MVAHVFEDGFHARAVWQINLEFRALFVFACLRRAFVCKHSLPFSGAHANQFSVLAERPLQVVEQAIRFEHSAFCYMKTKLTQTPPDFPKLVGQTELDFDFDLQSDTLIHLEGKCQIVFISLGFAAALVSHEAFLPCVPFITLYSLRAVQFWITASSRRWLSSDYSSASRTNNP